MLRRLPTLFAIALSVLPVTTQARPIRVERIVMVMRHGLRAPIDGEVPAGTRTAVPWPRWPVPSEHLTPHGAAMIRLHARADRQWMVRAGIVPATGCPRPGAIRIWTNVAERTIATGDAFAQGFAPECVVPVGHLAPGAIDPLFEPLRARASDFDPAKAIASINAYTGGVDRLTERYRPAIAALDRVLGCGLPAGCSPVTASAVRASADGHGIDLSGDIRTTSGTAQVLLLQYAEGLAGAGTQWPQVDAATLARLGVLHSALFDVFTRPPYMAAHQAGPLARRLLSTLRATDGPSLDLLVGHDTNVTALAAILGVTLRSPGYAAGDVAPGGALAFELIEDRHAAKFVRISYRTQSPDDLRRGSGGVTATQVVLPGCANGPGRSCGLADFTDLLLRRIAK